MKRIAAEKAAEFIESGMIIGLGSGSTAYYVIKKVGELISTGKIKNFLCVPTSGETKRIAEELNIPLTTLDANPVIDLTIDGADEVSFVFDDDKDRDKDYDQDKDKDKRSRFGSARSGSARFDFARFDFAQRDIKRIDCIKGGGGALLHEKIIAEASKEYIIVVDESKLSDRLFDNFRLPIEIIRMARVTSQKFIESICEEAELRLDSNHNSYLTDEGNFIIDARFAGGTDPAEIDSLLNGRAGIVENGLFLGLADKVVVGNAAGVKIITNCQDLQKI
ncbi:MAG: ribose-5-phosphate isomerase A [Melioribacteraceae bacterium]|nr:ribose-5-phosphate isomerase A [Melioribacteraceae bacterium]